MSRTREAGHVYALLADGTTVEIRPATPDDVDAVQAMHEAMSRDHAYLRFFNFSPQAGGIEAHRICRDPSPDQVALLALSGGEVVGCASYTVPRQPGESERTAGSRPSTAPSTAEGAFAAVGLPVDRHDEAGVYEMTFPLTGDALPAGDGGTVLDGYLDAVAERERRADIASLRHVLAPESVAVIGAGRSKGAAGRAILDNIRAGGYAGRLYAVNPRARQIGGERCLASALDLPEPADLAVIAVPAGSVLEVAEQCGQRGVRSLVVIPSGLDAGGCADLLAVCRRHGMRLVGPDGFGVAVPAIGLNATFTVRPPRPGVAGL